MSSGGGGGLNQSLKTFTSYQSVKNKCVGRDSKFKDVRTFCEYGASGVSRASFCPRSHFKIIGKKITG